MRPLNTYTVGRPASVARITDSSEIFVSLPNHAASTEYVGSNGNNFDFYSGGDWFESRPGQRISWNGFPQSLQKISASLVYISLLSLPYISLQIHYSLACNHSTLYRLSCWERRLIRHKKRMKSRRHILDNLILICNYFFTYWCLGERVWITNYEKARKLARMREIMKRLKHLVGEPREAKPLWRLGCWWENDAQRYAPRS
jgi:hypothetical protein